ncbi:MAG TPA: copper resistance protein CopC [Candidatus Dormibacteraeota bacterium]|nr:copper resistance protein CopC [Candidatus Dormibacteraeota bacterium]
MRNLCRGGLLAALATFLLATGVEAHALVRSSTPDDGASLDQAPTAVTITFTEPPDPRLSSISVLDAGGRPVQRGATLAGPGDPLRLSVLLGTLPDGVYTVNWRTVSAADGHTSGGAFAFGVGVAPDEVQAAPVAAPQSPPPDPLGVAGRWVLYVGVGLLLGGTWLSLVGFGGVRPGLHALALAGAGTAVAGLLAAAESQRRAAGVDWAILTRTSLGLNLVAQLAPLLVAALLLVLAPTLPAAAARALRWLAAAAGATAVLVHALDSHAPAAGLPWLMVAAQWVHVMAFAVWIGGLAALLVGTRGRPSAETATAVRRFSRVAAASLVIVGVTGLLRAIDEVGAWSKLASTLFGQLVVVKVGLLVALAGLGALNRLRHVPVAGVRLGGLRLVGGGELGVAAVLLVASALLTSLAPPSTVRAVAAGPPAPHIRAAGSDFGTTVRARLEVAPGYAGPNRFALTLVDYDSGRPVQATARLRFELPARRDVGESDVALARDAKGVYRARASNLSLVGRWIVTALIQGAADSVEVPLEVPVTAAPLRSHDIRTPGQPTITVQELPGGAAMQFTLEPGRAGANEAHVTFVDPGGVELAVPAAPVISARSASGATAALTVTRFTAGHFGASGTLAAGRWTFDVRAAAADGTPLEARFERAVGR